MNGGDDRTVRTLRALLGAVLVVLALVLGAAAFFGCDVEGASQWDSSGSTDGAAPASRVPGPAFRGELDGGVG